MMILIIYVLIVIDSLVNDPSKGYYVCNDCGVINQQYLDKHPEYNNYEDGKEEANRCELLLTFSFQKL